MSRVRIACVQNHHAEGPARIRVWSEARGHEMRCCRAFAANEIPIDEYDAFVVMGGPASVNDAAFDPGVHRALERVERFLETGKPVLGICLGAQMMAVVAGGRVVRGGRKEIGWFDIRVEQAEGHLLSGLPEQLTVFHWHGEQIDPPEGARRLASSEVCPVQAFQVGNRVLGLQCHLEVDRDAVEKMVHVFEDEILEGGAGVQSAGEMLAAVDRHGEACDEALAGMLDRWIES